MRVAASCLAKKKEETTLVVTKRQLDTKPASIRDSTLGHKMYS